MSKKRICFINSFSYGSTWNIIDALANEALKKGYEVSFILREKRKGLNNVLFISSNFFTYYARRLSSYFGGDDVFVRSIEDYKVRAFLEKNAPDIIHIHNVHGAFINLNIVLNYAKLHCCKIIWTLHDPWIVTGRCACFYDCNKWINGCKRCKKCHNYPSTINMFASKNWIKKRNLLTSNINFVCPSKFLASIIENAGCKNVTIINNGIDNNIFKPLSTDVSLFNKERKKVVGFAAFSMNKEKGSREIQLLANVFSGENVLLVSAGNLLSKTEKKGNLIMLPRLSKQEMAVFYNSLDVFVNPTHYDTFPTTHLEALSCHIPVITYDVGGAGDLINNGENGYKVRLGDFNGLVESIKNVINNSELFKSNMKKQTDYNQDKFIKSYFELYD